MTKPSVRRLAENQVVFRQRNEQVSKDLAALKQKAESEGHDVIAQNIEDNLDKPLHFYCECSDENCRQRIVLKPNEYNDLRQNSSQFLIISGYEVPQIERVVFKRDNFVVVEKFETPPQAADELNSTDLGNS